MKTKANKTLTILFISILMAFTLTACSTFPHRPADQAVRIRVEGLMTAKLNKDWAKAYTFFDESYQKAVSENQFIRKIEKIELKAFTIKSITVEPDGDMATVKVKSDVSIGGFDFKANTETQHWIRQGGEWFLQVPPRDSKEFFK
jgi:hypothetical protein